MLASSSETLRSRAFSATSHYTCGSCPLFWHRRATATRSFDHSQRWQQPRRLDIRAAQTSKIPEKDTAKLRSEVEAPFRTFRLVIFGFFVVSASIGLTLAIVQTIGDVVKGKELTTDLQNIAIDAGAAGLFGFLGKRDLDAREKQMTRLMREESLGALQVELGNRKRLRLTDLRSFARVVLVAGTPDQVESAVSQAEPMRRDLLDRGVMVVPLPIFDADGSGSGVQSTDVAESSTEELSKEEALKWRAKPLQPEKWRAWFSEQMKSAGASPDRGLYVGLRLDGRVRASGAGVPPWPAFVAQLAPLKGEGAWTGFFDVFDGRI